MTVFSALKEKYNNWQSENYMYCPICNKVKIKKESRACNNCKTRLVADIKMQQQGYYRILGDIDKGYKKLEPYLSRYQILLETMQKVYEELQYVPERVQLTPRTFEEFKENLLENDLNDIIKEKKDILIHKFSETGEILTFKEIKKLRNEILDMQIKYPQFRRYLKIDELKEVIDKGEQI